MVSIYEIVNIGKGVITTIAPANLLLIKDGNASGGFNKIFYWDGAPFAVPAFYAGTLWNMTRNAPVTYALVGTTLTPTSGEADNGETLQATSN